jgi:hypothetical protein
MKQIASILAALLMMLVHPGISGAAPELKVIPSRNSIQKGTVFDIRLEIAAREAMSEILIVPLVPSGFTLLPVHSPGIDVGKNDQEVVSISHLKPGSTIAVVFAGTTPDIIGKSGVSTAEAKTFGFNVLYSV